MQEADARRPQITVEAMSAAGAVLLSFLRQIPFIQTLLMLGAAMLPVQGIVFYSDWQCLQLRTRARISCSKLPNASHFGALASSAGVAPQLCGMAGLKKNGIAEEGLT